MRPLPVRRVAACAALTALTLSVATPLQAEAPCPTSATDPLVELECLVQRKQARDAAKAAAAREQAAREQAAAKARAENRWLSIPGGTFGMGDAAGEADERPVHSVTLGAFEMQAYEVTNGQYESCVAAGACKAPGSEASVYGYGSSSGNNPQRPVNYVDWEQAVAFCRHIGGRLPTEAEWEYAARGGLSGKRYPWGDEEATCSRANIDGCGGTTKPVGSHAANGYGLHDMAGNVWEWVSDWYSDSYYASSPSSTPQGPDSGDFRVLRGGSFSNAPYSARVADRNNNNNPKYQYHNVGFRCAR